MNETRETIALDYEGNRFKFFAEANVVEKQHIKRVAEELLGGMENYAKLIALADNSFMDHQKHCKNKFGIEGFLLKEKELITLAKDEEKKAEWQALYEEIYGNKFYLQFLNLTKEQTKVEKYASLIVLKIEPKSFDLRQTQEVFLDGLLKEVETKVKFFREQKKQDKEVNTA